MSFKEKILTCNSVSNDNVYGLWMGRDLSELEIMSINSFLDKGHKYILYAYDSFKNVPEGVEIKDANKILSYDNFNVVERNASHPYTTFSNWFRYEMLYQHGGWWVDLDVICLKKFDFEYTYVFSGYNLKDEHGNLFANPCVIKSPDSSLLFKSLIDMCEETKGAGRFTYNGFSSFFYFVKYHCLMNFIMPYATFEPDLDINKINKDKTYAIHFKNHAFSEEKMTKMKNILENI